MSSFLYQNTDSAISFGGGTSFNPLASSPPRPKYDFQLTQTSHQISPPVPLPIRSNSFPSTPPSFNFSPPQILNDPPSPSSIDVVICGSSMHDRSWLESKVKSMMSNFEVELNSAMSRRGITLLPSSLNSIMTKHHQLITQRLPQTSLNHLQALAENLSNLHLSKVKKDAETYILQTLEPRTLDWLQTQVAVFRPKICILLDYVPSDTSLLVDSFLSYHQSSLLKLISGISCLRRNEVEKLFHLNNEAKKVRERHLKKIKMLLEKKHEGNKTKQVKWNVKEGKVKRKSRKNVKKGRKREEDDGIKEVLGVLGGLHL
ncbi:hypothetical protein TrLO_g2430 [Triparma laevis f. longispina]|uniref:Uncharacterized protein n=1 Tax=Triparma laevis f. longispina TaxID=1714387 RepID=A0A9W7KX34_9STRA|nr:hypothetical protein TrLO_g2430 [Triparma laevis f. longispina]